MSAPKPKLCQRTLAYAGRVCMAKARKYQALAEHSEVTQAIEAQFMQEQRALALRVVGKRFERDAKAIESKRAKARKVKR